MVYFSVKNIMFPLFFSIWPFIVNAEVVVVVPVPKKELITLQESAAKQKNVWYPINSIMVFWLLPGTYICMPEFSPQIKGGAVNIGHFN